MSTNNQPLTKTANTNRRPSNNISQILTSKHRVVYVLARPRLLTSDAGDFVVGSATPAAESDGPTRDGAKSSRAPLTGRGGDTAPETDTPPAGPGERPRDPATKRAGPSPDQTLPHPAAAHINCRRGRSYPTARSTNSFLRSSPRSRCRGSWNTAGAAANQCTKPPSVGRDPGVV